MTCECVGGVNYFPDKNGSSWSFQSIWEAYRGIFWNAYRFYGSIRLHR